MGLGLGTSKRWREVDQVLTLDVASPSPGLDLDSPDDGSPAHGGRRRESESVVGEQHVSPHIVGVEAGSVEKSDVFDMACATQNISKSHDEVVLNSVESAG